MSSFDPFGGLPADNDLLTSEMEVVVDGLVRGVSGLKVRVPDVPDVDEMVATSGLPRLPKNRSAPPLEEYVASELEHVRRLVAAGLKNEVHRGEDRFARAERYARWRWQGYKDGEIKEL